MATSAYAATAISGGTDGALDSIKVATLADGDICFVIDNTEEFLVYRFESSSTTAENSPTFIRPDDYSTAGVWHLLDLTTDVMTVLGTMAVTGTSAFTGNVTMAGTLDIGSTTPIAGMLDEDNFASDSATEAATQQSIKAYIATQITGASLSNVTGWTTPAQFIYSDSDTITIRPARYHHDGTSEQIMEWDSTLTYDFGSGGSNAGSTDLGGSEWHYLYLDDSAIVTAGTSTVSASELLNSTTAPSWTDAKLGYYNGNDRCIGAFRTDASNNLLIFYHDGSNLIQYDQAIEDRSSTYTATAWEDVTLTIPGFANTAQVTFLCGQTSNHSASTYYYRTNGSSATTGHQVGRSQYNGAGDGINGMNDNTIKVFTDSSYKIEVKSTLNDAQAGIAVWTDGYYMPKGII